jgi:hypothetical protein
LKNLNANAVEPDGLQQYRTTAGVIAQRYSFKTFVLLHFHPQ